MLEGGTCSSLDEARRLTVFRGPNKLIRSSVKQRALAARGQSGDSAQELPLRADKDRINKHRNSKIQSMITREMAKKVG